MRTAGGNMNHTTPAAEEGFPEQARIERGYWTGQLGTDEIDTPMRSLNDATPAEWDQVSTGVISIGDGLATNVPGEDEPDGFDIPDLNLQAANPLDTQIGGDHYRHMEIQPIEFITSNKLGWCEGHVVKYVSRHASKGGKQDLEKAKHYIDMLIEEVYYDE